MNAYVIRRILVMFPTIFIVVTLLFTLIRLIPGDIVTFMVEDNAYAPSADALRERLGISGSIPEQFVNYITGLARGDLGDSLKTGRSAWQEIRERGPVSFQLGVMSLTISLIVAIPFGVLSAIRPGSVMDYSARGFATAMLAIPHFWLATLVIIIPSIMWNMAVVKGWVPLFEDPVANLQGLMLPALIGGAGSSATVMRMTRTMVLEVIRQDYVRTAQAKGLTERTVIGRHVLKNAMIPVITLIGLQIPSIIAGSVIMETIFALPGMGRFLVDSISQRDYPMIQAITLMFTVAVMLVNLAVDLSYQYFDPRIRLGR